MKSKNKYTDINWVLEIVQKSKYKKKERTRSTNRHPDKYNYVERQKNRQTYKYKCV